MDDKSNLVYLGAGCFWNAELIFSKIDGVEETEVGWVTIPIHDNKKSRVEVVKITYNPDLTSIENLVEQFWTTHNPTHRYHLNENYIERSVLVALDKTQEEIMIKELIAKKKQDPKVLTSVLPFEGYDRAPEKDQQYYFKN